VSPAAPRAVTRRAHAKINVFLRVLGRRHDGFHDIETLVLPISLHDIVTAEVAEPGHASVQVDGDGALTKRLPGSVEDNLAGRAIVAVAERARPSEGARVVLDKRIPVAAGLGGGSADAAATVLALRELWRCDLDAETMAAIAVGLGSDVPALLADEPVLAAGRGERLTPVHSATTWWVLRPLGLEVSAADAYRWWDETPTTGPDAGVLIAALETGDVELLGTAVFNDLQPAVASRHLEIGSAIDAFLEAGALGAFMCGSGPTVAALARHIGHADSLAAAVPGSIVVSGPPVRPRETG
jgi:4-diphosphocytidyl-2-C-methyl-D-erythritol kinase